MTNITSQELTIGERRILTFLGKCPERAFFGPQKELAQAVGRSRQHTNVLLHNLCKKGYLHISDSRSINKKERLITLDPLGEVLNG